MASPLQEEGACMASPYKKEGACNAPPRYLAECSAHAEQVGESLPDD